MSHGRRLTTADVLRELALDRDSDMKPSHTNELADFLSNESDSESNSVEVKPLINQVQVLVDKF